MQLKTVFLALVVLLALFSCAEGKKHGKKHGKKKRSLLHKSEGHRKDKVPIKRHTLPQEVNDGKSEKVVLYEKVDDSTGSLETNRLTPDSSLPELSNSASQNNKRSKRSQASKSQKRPSSLPESSAPNSFGLEKNSLWPDESSVPGRIMDVPPPSGSPPSEQSSSEQSSSEQSSSEQSSSETFTDESFTDGIATNGTSEPANGLLDVGQIRAVSVSEICNGVLIDPQIVLTSASCVFLDYKSAEHENITFTLNAVTRQVVKVFANRDWRVDGQRKTDFALVRLDQPMIGTKASHPIELTWSPYALEDIGESFLAMPAASSCQTASKKAQRTDEARYLNDDVITVDCHDRGAALAGSPLYRVVSGQPVVYGVHFGHCTTGALDRSITGSCGARITKNVFRDFCRFASQEIISLTGCESSTLLQLLTKDLPTTVYDNQTYDAIHSTVTNLKGAVLVYYSSNSSKWADVVTDIEAIQRTKVVYDKFLVAIINVQTLPYKVDAVPFIEYRAVGSKTYFPYTADYDFEKFKKFMVSFSTVGAPPTESTNFLEHLNFAKRSSIERVDDGEFPDVQSSRIKNAIVIPESTKRQGLTCHDKAYLIKNEPTERCHCLPGYFGSGTNCQDLTAAIETHCRFDVDATTLRRLAQIKVEVAASAWCQSQKLIVGYLENDAADVDVAGDKLVALDCVDEIRELIRCPKSSTFMADSSEHNHNESYSLVQRDRREVFSAEDMEFDLLDRPRRTVTSTATVPVPVDYLSSFLGSLPPSPTQYPSTNSYFIYQDWHPAAPNKYSTLYFGDRGIPEYTGYYLNHANLVSLSTGPGVNRKSVSNAWHVEPGVVLQGSNDFYKNGQPSTSNFKHFRTDKGHLNPVGINSFDKDNMRLTFTYTNAYPQYVNYNRGTWRTFEGKIRKYAKTVCLGKDPVNSKFHLVTGLSDVEISTSTATGGYTPLRHPLANKWPSLASAPISTTMVPIVMPRSMWTVGCCSWTDAGGAHKAQSVSVWVNNYHKLSPTDTKNAFQPDLPTLAKELYPTAGSSCFKFFPANSECDKASNHYNLP